MKPESLLTQLGNEQFRAEMKDRGLPPDYIDLDPNPKQMKENLRNLTLWNNYQIDQSIPNPERIAIADSLSYLLSRWNGVSGSSLDILPTITVKQIARLTGLSAELIIEQLSRSPIPLEKLVASVPVVPKEDLPNAKTPAREAGRFGVNPKRALFDSRYGSKQPGGGPVVKWGLFNKEQVVLKMVNQKRKILLQPKNQIANNEPLATFKDPEVSISQQSFEPESANSIAVTGGCEAFMRSKGLIRRFGSLPYLLKESNAQLQQSTDGNFVWGTAVQIPDTLEIDGRRIEPMLYINEGSFGISDEFLSSIPELVIANDNDIIRWLIEAASLKSRIGNDSLWIFPGGGGKYMQEELRKRDVNPMNSVEISARRKWDNGKLSCESIVDDSVRGLLGGIKDPVKIVFVDDAVSTGVTARTVLEQLKERVLIESLILVTGALASPRKKEDLEALFKKMDFPVELYAGLFYGGKSKRPRLLTTGSIVQGIQEPERFSNKNYPPELIQRIKEALNL